MIIIGAGLAGMTTAYELGKLGYNCQVLEARERPGGRAHTIRRGTVSEEDGPTQTCAFDEGRYFNCGAMRIAYHHSTTLAYCRELQVPVETFSLRVRSGYLYQAKATALKDRRLRFREVHTDMDGYVSELLSKAVSNHALDEALTAEDARAAARVSAQQGRARRLGPVCGWSAARRRLAGRRRRHAALHAVQARASCWDPAPATTSISDSSISSRCCRWWAARIACPARSPRGSAKIVYKAAVASIRQRENGVTVVYRDGKGGSQEVQADYCVAALPLPLLAQIDTDFPADFKDTIAKVPYAAAGKMGMQFKRRFWEEDDRIFGGASKTDMEIGADRLSVSRLSRTRRACWWATTCRGRRGGRLATRRRPSGWRWRWSRAAKSIRSIQRIRERVLGRLAPRHLEQGIVVQPEPRRPKALSEPQGRVYLAGDHLNLNAWMQGAFESARHTATAVHTRAVAERATARV